MKKIRVFLLRPVPSALHLRMQKNLMSKTQLLGQSKSYRRERLKELFSKIEDEKIHRRPNALWKYNDDGGGGEGPGSRMKVLDDLFDEEGSFF